MPHAKRPSEEREDGAEIHYVANAGLVLTGPFLPRLFDRLGIRHAGDRAIDGHEAASCAVHALQYLVDGRTDAPEPALVLNKLLCGLDPSAPVAPRIELSPEQARICDELLRALIANWTVIANSSVAALRETFLQREGRLERRDGAWTLIVQRKTLDVLVDQVPWSFATVFHGWMKNPIRVTW